MSCKSCFAQIQDLKRLRVYLRSHVALMAANVLVCSRLDYCNYLFRSLSALDLHKLQCVQNSLARIITNTTKYSHITSIRKTLHCLLNIIIYLTLPYWCTSSYKVVIHNILYLSLNRDIEFTKHVKTKLMVCCLRSHTLSIQYVNPPSISATALLMTKFCSKVLE